MPCQSTVKSIHGILFRDNIHHAPHLVTMMGPDNHLTRGVKITNQLQVAPSYKKKQAYPTASAKFLATSSQLTTFQNAAM